MQATARTVHRTCVSEMLSLTNVHPCGFVAVRSTPTPHVPTPVDALGAPRAKPLARAPPSARRSSCASLGHQLLRWHGPNRSRRFCATTAIGATCSSHRGQADQSSARKKNGHRWRSLKRACASLGREDLSFDMRDRLVSLGSYAIMQLEHDHVGDSCHIAWLSIAADKVINRAAQAALEGTFAAELDRGPQRG